MSLLRFFRALKASRRDRRANVAPRFTPKVINLESRITPNGYMAIGAGPGSLPWVAIRVDIRDALGGNALNTLNNPNPARSDGKTDFTSQVFMPFMSGFRGGVHTATGNFDGLSSTPDSLVTAAGAGGGPHVIVWNTRQLADGSIVTDGVRDQFFAFDSRFRGGVNITTGDLDGDGKAELICAAGAGGGPHVKIYRDVNGRFQLANEFFAFDASFRGGVNVASGQGYRPTVQMRLVLDALDFLPVPYGNDIFDPNKVLPVGPAPGAGLDIPLVGIDRTIPAGQTEFFGPNNGYVVPNGVAGSLNNGATLPYFTVGSGPIQYLSANLLNNFGNVVYRPDIFIDPNLPNPNGRGDIVVANWDVDSPNRPAWAVPGVDYGPFVRLSGGSVARLTEGPGEVNFVNQLVVGAGPGGGPHVKVFDFAGTNDGRLQNNGVGKEFFAFDANFRGGVNVAINDVVANSQPGSSAPVPGRYDYVSQTFIRDTDQNSGTQAFTQFPIDPALFDKLKPEIVVAMASQGSSVRIFGDSAPLTFDLQSQTFIPARRTQLQELNMVAYVIDSLLATDPNVNALNNFQSNQLSTTFRRAVDNFVSFNGGVNLTVSAFQFNGSMQTGFFGTNAVGGGNPISTNPALGKAVFGAGTTPNGQATRGTRVRSFNQMGAFAFNEVEFQAYDDFQAIPDMSAQGAWVSYGFGVLPESANALDVIYANYNAGPNGAANQNQLDIYDPPSLSNPVIA